MFFTRFVFILFIRRDAGTGGGGQEGQLPLLPFAIGGERRAEVPFEL